MSFCSLQAIMDTNKFPIDLIQSLSGSPQTLVRVVVRPSLSFEKSSFSNSKIDPKNFSTPVEYRTALIAGRRQQTQPGKDAVLAKAKELGLDASAAGTLNAVLVEGKAGQVARLLNQTDVESASFDNPNFSLK